jgi:ABC-type multidrug transport system fused ATPase/permease subunit
LLVPDSIVVQWVAQMNPHLQAFARMLTTWLQIIRKSRWHHPERALLFLLRLFDALEHFALGMALPTLITRDLASNAIVIYSSKAVTRGDYLLGKFCTAFGVMTLTWLGPVCGRGSWEICWRRIGNFSGTRASALFHALIFGLSSMVISERAGLGVSACSSREKSTPALWFTWWALGLAIQPIASTPAVAAAPEFWLQFAANRLATFRLGQDLKTAQDSIPILGKCCKMSPETAPPWNDPTLGGAAFGPGVDAGGGGPDHQKTRGTRMSALIQAQELSRWYGIVMGLNNVSFQIEPGLTGLVGPNGAGKSTLIQIITGQLKPSSGELTVFGEEPWNNPPCCAALATVRKARPCRRNLPAGMAAGLGLLSGLAG